ncbi:hypothetical protein [Blastococcus sp. LR1]|uniref:hypothetical protein n=1 Tax=Blastococcus sp. LR1 TaxID=2877000 RepID=UPI001CCFFD12|nr:hypothetical protein [Blastococcus sp. LR1]MCA0143370.1 hypothetical protein [Blastococcus sp. LR1]
MQPTDRRRRWRRALIGLPLVVVGAGLTWVVLVVVELSSYEDPAEADRRAAVLEAELLRLPGVVTASVVHQDNWVVRGDLDASLDVEPGSDLAEIADEAERLAWLSDFDVVESVDVHVRVPDPTGVPGPTESRSYAEECAESSGSWCTSVAVLEDRYGPRPG